MIEKGRNRNWDMRGKGRRGEDRIDEKRKKRVGSVEEVSRGGREWAVLSGVVKVKVVGDCIVIESVVVVGVVVEEGGDGGGERREDLRMVLIAGERMVIF